MTRPLFHPRAAQTDSQGPKTDLELFLADYARQISRANRVTEMSRIRGTRSKQKDTEGHDGPRN